MAVNSELLEGAWAANAPRLSEILSDHELVGDLAATYGRIEELRWRLIKSLIAIGGGVAAGYWLVTTFDVIAFLKQPIDPYLPAGHKVLLFTHPMEPFMLTLKLALASFPEGDYRLEIKVTDKIANKSLTREINFSVGPA